MEWSGRLKCLCIKVNIHDLWWLILTFSGLVVHPMYCFLHLVQDISCRLRWLRCMKTSVGFGR